jgi:hypothetical protein
MQIFILVISCTCTESLRFSSPIEALNLYLIFWEQLHENLGTKLIRSSAYHPQISGQTEQVNQTMEDMLRACIIHFDKSLDKFLALAEFSYNDRY